MSLFICSNPECLAIENTNCVTSSMGSGYNWYKDAPRTEEHPFMALMDMQGHGSFGKDIRMLCCKCNTGKHHNEFEHTKANEAELRLATYSNYRMITPYDHKPRGVCYPDENARFGFSALSDKELEQLKGVHKFLLGPNLGAIDIANRQGTKKVPEGYPVIKMLDDREVYITKPTELVSRRASEKLLKLADMKRKLKAMKKDRNINKVVYNILQTEYENLRQVR